MFDWYVIVNKFTGKKIKGGLMHLGGALAKHGKMLREDATEDEIAEYDAIGTSAERRVELLTKWEDRCIYKIVSRMEYNKMRKEEVA